MGIAFSRDTMIRTCGVKNVIYGDKAEELALKRIGLDWGYEPLDVDAYDVEQLREWRIYGKELDVCNFPLEEMLIITPTESDLHDLIVQKDIDYTVDINL